MEDDKILNKSEEGSDEEVQDEQDDESIDDDEKMSDADEDKFDGNLLKPLASREDGKFKYGIIYLSYIPEGLNVKMLKEIMSQFGQVGRAYLEPDETSKKYRTYVEGWVEFKKKRVAKAVAKKLNGTTLQYGRKHCKLNGQMWSIKYLHRFKWAHLTEQLAHDRAIREQKRKFELTQAKKQVDFYQKMTEQSRIMKKTLKKDNHEINETESRKIKNIESRQKRPTNKGEELSVSVDEDLLGSIFKKVS